MKKSEILAMIETSLPEHVHIRRCQDMHEVTLLANDLSDLESGAYGVVELSLMVRLDGKS